MMRKQVQKKEIMLFANVVEKNVSNLYQSVLKSNVGSEGENMKSATAAPRGKIKN